MRSSATSAAVAASIARPLRIGQPCALEGDARVRVLLEIDQHIAVGQPRAMMVRASSPAPAAPLRAPGGAAVAAIGARQIHARIGEIRRVRQQRLEGRDAFRDLVLLQQRGAQQPPANRLSGNLCVERTQQPFGRGRAAGAQRRMRLPELLRETGFWFQSCQELHSKT